MSFRTIEWRGDRVVMLDQRLLPDQEIYREYTDHRGVAEAIRTMVIRGAPAIGVAAAMGMALGAREIVADSFDSFYRQLENIGDLLARSRPTAVNLFWAIERMKERARERSDLTIDSLKELLRAEAVSMEEEDLRICRMIGSHGSRLIRDGWTVLTHCNAGALATAGYGTALGVIRAAHAEGKNISVIADETRPWLQGARLTAWELMKEKIPVTLICDDMAGWLMKKGEIHCVVVGADRIAANGDTANKIGTYSVAVLAREHRIPFYVAAPLSTVDLTRASGDDIPIEERSPLEVTEIRGVAIAPAGVTVRNPSFDVTPSRYITGIITERGVARDDYGESLRRMLEGC